MALLGKGGNKEWWGLWHLPMYMDIGTTQLHLTLDKQR